MQGQALQLQLSLQRLSSTALHLHPAPSLHGHTHGLSAAPLEVASSWCPERCSKGSTREAPCPPKAAGYEVMNAIGRDGARWGGRLRVTHSLHSQHPNPPALPPWHDPGAHCHQLVATARSPLQCHPNHLPARPPASLSIQGGIATRKSQIKPSEEMPQLSGQTAHSCVGAGCFLPHKGGLSQASTQQSQALLFANFLKPQNGPFQTGTGGEAHPTAPST